MPLLFCTAWMRLLMARKTSLPGAENSCGPGWLTASFTLTITPGHPACASECRDPAPVYFLLLRPVSRVPADACGGPPGRAPGLASPARAAAPDRLRL